MILPSVTELYLLASAIAAVQLGATWLLQRRLRFEAARAAAAHFPSVAVIVPFKGAPEGLEDNVAAILSQDHSGRLSFVFVVQDESDPAYERLKSMRQQRPDPRVRLLLSREPPRRCAGQISNLLHGAGAAPEDAEVLLFADSDIRPPPFWISRLAAPLQDPRVTVSTTFALPVPARAAPGTWLRLLWFAAGLPYYAARPWAAGPSIAMRRRDFDALGVAEAWSRSLSNDVSLTRRVRAAGGEIRFVPGAMPGNPGESSFSEVLAGLNRWAVIQKFYLRPVWVLALLVLAAKLWCLGRSLWPPGPWGLAAFVVAADMANLAAILAVLEAAVPHAFDPLPRTLRPAPLWGALWAPALLALQAANYAQSLWRDTVEWSGWRYRLAGPEDVEVIGNPGD